MGQSIRNKIFVSHLILILLLIGGLTVYHYHLTLSSLKHTTIASTKASVASLVNHATDAVAGNNYANLLGPSFQNEVKSHTNLVYFALTGTSLHTQSPMEVLFHRRANQLWRSHYPNDFDYQLIERKTRLNARKAAMDESKVKLAFLLNRLNDAEQLFKQNRKLSQYFRVDLSRYRAQGSGYINFDKELLYLALPLHDGVGEIEMLFSIKSIGQMREQFLMHAFCELLIGIGLAIPTLLLLSLNISRPIQALSQYISQHIDELEADHVPNTQRRDEIGELAQAFSELVRRIAHKNTELQALSHHDPLTGLLNRRALEPSFGQLKQNNPTALVSLVYIDVDHFKAYNDHFGHCVGDAALKQIADAIEFAANSFSGYGFRLGGEEFLLVLPSQSNGEVMSIAETFRESINLLAIAHPLSPVAPHLTISIGVASSGKEHNKDAVRLLEHADKALYQAKQMGRNMTVLYQAIEAETSLSAKHHPSNKIN